MIWHIDTSKMKPGDEIHEASKHVKGFIEYHHKDENNQLFSCIAPTLKRCRENKQSWGRCTHL